MELEDNYAFETPEQFWHTLEETISQPCNAHERIDDALRRYLALTTNFPEYIESDNELRRCAYKLYSSPLFSQHADYIRTQFVHCLLQDDEPEILHITSTFLIADARENETTFELLNSEGAFPRMVELIRAPRQDGEEGLHRLLMELLYEMARVQKIANDSLMCVDDDFIRCLFGIIEGVSGDVTDPYHYPVIRVLLVLNEQFMVSASEPNVVQHKAAPLTNKVIKVLSTDGSKYKTFGENIILLLNREDETSLQLLTLKLLYLLFTTPSTFEYFYTNDLHVLVDILIRNLLDLPEEAAALRHTYLRVLYPLLEHTQLQQPPHYKCEELRKLLSVMAGSNIEETDTSFMCHFEDVDETTKRLVKRCQTVSWLTDPAEEIPQAESPTDAGPLTNVNVISPSTTSRAPPAVPAPRKLKKRSSSRSSDLNTGPYLNPQLESARQSNLSMMEMATQREKPGVKTPSRNPSLRHGLRGLVIQKKEKPPPPPPKARRSAWRKERTAENTTSEVANTTLEGVEHSETEGSIPEHIDENTSPTTAPKPMEKKPPPAPKTRRWRGRREKEDIGTVGNNVRPKEPGRFNTDLPSIVTSPPEQTNSEQSPFSPPSEKTLSPSTGTESSSPPHGPTSSVSAALGRAQVQAIQNIEETLEKANIDIHHNHHQPHPQSQQSSDPHHESPPLKRTVLAPPGQAPLRGVPGPTMQLERSPFLSDNEIDERISEESLQVSTEEDEQQAGEGLHSQAKEPGDRKRVVDDDGDQDDPEESEDEWN